MRDFEKFLLLLDTELHRMVVTDWSLARYCQAIMSIKLFHTLFPMAYFMDVDGTLS